LGVGVFGLSTQTGEEQAEAKRRLHLPYPLVSDHDLRLATALSLPAFAWRTITCIKRLTLVIRDGVIQHVFYPIFPSDTHPDAVLAWVRTHDV